MVIAFETKIDERCSVGTRVSGFRIGLAFLIDFVMLSLALRGNRAFRDDSLCSSFGYLWFPCGARPWMALKFRLRFDKQMASHHLAGILVVAISIWFPKGCSSRSRFWDQDLTDNSPFDLYLWFCALLCTLIVPTVLPPSSCSVVILFDRLAGASMRVPCAEEEYVRMKLDHQNRERVGQKSVIH